MLKMQPLWHPVYRYLAQHAVYCTMRCAENDGTSLVVPLRLHLTDTFHTQVVVVVVGGGGVTGEGGAPGY